jgi:hypothetical protein
MTGTMPVTRLHRRRLLLLVAVTAAVVLGAACEPAPGTTPTPPAAPSTDYRIARTDPDGSIVRWNPCRPVRYVVNLQSAPAFAVAELQAAAAEIERASGIDLVYAGTTTERPVGRKLRDLTRYGTGYSPVLVSFASALEFPFDAPSASGFGTGWTAYDSSGHRQYVSGMVVLRPGGWTAGTTTANPLRIMLQHELGHVMGLGHAPSTREIMGTGGNGTMRTWGAGDLVGFQKVGRPAGCLPTIG